MYYLFETGVMKLSVYRAYIDADGIAYNFTISDSLQYVT